MAHPGLLAQLKSNIGSHMEDATSYGKNGPMACYKSICAILQDVEPGEFITGSTIKHYMSLLTEQRCTNCGIVSPKPAGIQFVVNVHQISKTAPNPKFTLFPALPAINTDVKS